MKFTFVYNDISIDQQPRYNFAIGHLSASLKQAGHTVSLVHNTRPVEPLTLVKAVERESPDLVGFSSTTSTFRHDRALARELQRSLAIPIICGGVHPTLSPLETLAGGGFDMICLGEGDRALVELCAASDLRHSDVPNIWYQDERHVRRTPLRPLIEDLDTLPFLDREVFVYEKLEESRKGYARVMISRGCPYRCTYCCNHRIKALTQGQGRFVRVQSVGRVVEELEALLRAYPFVKYLIFYDSIFPLEQKWLEQFAREYRARIGLPFSCNCRPDLMTSHRAHLLRAAGCHKVKFGIESGSEELRRTVLRRSISQQQIKDAFRTCKESGLLTQSYNIIGIPGETPATALETIKLNAEIDPQLAWRATFYPFPNTDLYDRCQRDNLLASHSYDTYFEGPAITLPTITEGQVDFIFQFYYLLIRWYKVLSKLPPRAQDYGEHLTCRVLASGWFPSSLLARLKKKALKKAIEQAPRLMLTIMRPSDE